MCDVLEVFPGIRLSMKYRGGHFIFVFCDDVTDHVIVF